MTGPTVVEMARDGNRPRITMRSALLAARLIRQEGDCAQVGLVGTSALLLGGDHVRIDVRVGSECALEIVEIAATVAYNADHAASSWRVRAVVEDGGLLVWHGLPLIVADGANVLRQLDLSLHGSAIACVTDTLVLGRTGERGGTVRASTAVLRDDRQLFMEQLSIDDLARPGGRDAVLRGHRVVDTVALLGMRAPDEPVSEPPLPGRRFELAGPGTVGRELRIELAGSSIPARARSWERHARGEFARIHENPGLKM